MRNGRSRGGGNRPSTTSPRRPPGRRGSLPGSVRREDASPRSPPSHGGNPRPRRRGAGTLVGPFLLDRPGEGRAGDPAVQAGRRSQLGDGRQGPEDAVYRGAVAGGAPVSGLAGPPGSGPPPRRP